MDNISYNFKEKTIHIDGDFKLANVDEAMDLILSAVFEHDCNKVILKSENLDESFFDLKTKFAGELLQKVVNYNCVIAIVGEFEKYGSKALNDFIFECNNVASQVFFLSSTDEAVNKLKQK